MPRCDLGLLYCTGSIAIYRCETKDYSSVLNILGFFSINMSPSNNANANHLQSSELPGLYTILEEDRDNTEQRLLEQMESESGNQAKPFDIEGCIEAECKAGIKEATQVVSKSVEICTLEIEEAIQEFDELTNTNKTGLTPLDADLNEDNSGTHDVDATAPHPTSGSEGKTTFEEIDPQASNPLIRCELIVVLLTRISL